MLTPHQKIELVERALFEQLRHDTPGRIVVSGSWVQTIVPEIPMEFANRVYRCRVGEDEVDGRIAATIEQYRSIECPFQWVVSPLSSPESLTERLLAAGLRQAHVVTGLVVEPGQVAHRPKSPDVAVEPVGEANLDDWVSLQVTGWGMPPSVAGRLRERAARRLCSGDGRWLALLGRVGGVPVGGMSGAFCDGFVQVGEAIVLPEHRGHHVVRTLHRTLVDAILERGSETIVTHGINATSAQPLLQVGYEAVCELVYFRSPPAAAPRPTSSSD